MVDCWVSIEPRTRLIHYMVDDINKVVRLFSEPFIYLVDRSIPPKRSRPPLIQDPQRPVICSAWLSALILSSDDTDRRRSDYWNHIRLRASFTA